jgi:hypothetical protein
LDGRAAEVGKPYAVDLRLVGMSRSLLK